MDDEEADQILATLAAGRPYRYKTTVERSRGPYRGYESLTATHVIMPGTVEHVVTYEVDDERQALPAQQYLYFLKMR